MRTHTYTHTHSRAKSGRTVESQCWCTLNRENRPQKPFPFTKYEQQARQFIKDSMPLSNCVNTVRLRLCSLIVLILNVIPNEKPVFLSSCRFLSYTFMLILFSWAGNVSRSFSSSPMCHFDANSAHCQHYMIVRAQCTCHVIIIL